MASIGGERMAAVRHARRAAGQAGALASLIAGERPFADIAQQLLAVRGSLDSLLLRLIALELGACVPNLRTRVEIDGLLRAALGGSAHGRPSGSASRPPVPSATLSRSTPAPEATQPARS